MRYFWIILIVVLCAPLCLSVELVNENVTFDALATYGYGQDRVPLRKINHLVNKTHNDAAARHNIENRLIALIESDSATVDGKAFACEMLSRIGSPLAAFPVAKLLADPVLSTHALVALEQIPRGEANRALREAVPGLEGDFRIGTINAMGNRRASISVKTLSGLLDTPEYADAAAAALGAIGDNDAFQALTVARAQKGPNLAIEQALLQSVVSSDPEHSISTYDYLYREGSSEPVKVAGYTGLLQHRDDVTELLREALIPENRRFIQATLIALGNPETTESVATGLAGIFHELPPETQELIVTALAARTDAAATMAISPSMENAVAVAKGLQQESFLKNQQQDATILPEDPIIPDGYKIAAYLNCGAQQCTPSNSVPAISLVSGLSYTFADVQGAVGTVAFDAEKVVYEISGLNPETEYVLGFTWWDADNKGRIQSVDFSKDGSTWETVLPPVRPAAYNKDESTWARVLLPLTTPYDTTETLQVAFVNEGGPNAVVNEIFLLERNASAKAKRILIVTGDDYPGHVWRDTAPELAALLREDDRLEVSINECPAILGSPLLNHYDAVVLHFKNYAERLPLGKECLDGLAAYAASGKGLVVVHFGCGAFQEYKEFVNVAGRVWNPAFRPHDPRGAFTVHVTDEKHAITQNISDFETTDELYTCLDGNTPITVLCDAVSSVDGKAYPMAFVVEGTGGRVFHSVLGHDPVAFQSAGVRSLYRQATAWASGLEVH